MKTTRFLFSVAAIAMLMTGCSKGGKGQKGKETGFEQFIAKVDALPAKDAHPFVKATGTYEVHGQQKQTYEFEWNAILKTWTAVQTSVPEVLLQFVMTNCKDLKAQFIAQNTAQPDNYKWYIDPLSAEYTVDKNVNLSIWNEYGLATYASQKSDGVDAMVMTVEYAKDKSGPTSQETSQQGGTSGEQSGAQPTSQAQSQEYSQEQSQEQSKEESKEESKEQSQEQSATSQQTPGQSVTPEQFRAYFANVANPYKTAHAVVSMTAKTAQGNQNQSAEFDFTYDVETGLWSIVGSVEEGMDLNEFTVEGYVGSFIDEGAIERGYVMTCTLNPHIARVVADAYGYSFNYTLKYNDYALPTTVDLLQTNSSYSTHTYMTVTYGK